MGWVKLLGWLIGLSVAVGAVSMWRGTSLQSAVLQGVIGGVGLVGLFYLVTPLLIYFIMSMNLDPDQLAEVPREAVPGEVVNWLEEVETQLEALGFLPMGNFLLEKMVPNVDTLMFMFVLPEQQTLVMATIIETTVKTAEQTQIQHKYYVEFSTELADGREFNTGNVKEPDSPDSLPRKRSFRLPDEADLSVLWRLHQAVLADEARGVARRPLLLERSWEEVLFEDLDQELAEKAEAGFWVKRGRRYKLTLKGAYLQTWAELPPWKGRRHARLQAQARELRARYLA